MIECADTDGAMITKSGVKVYVLIRVPRAVDTTTISVDYRVIGIYSKSEYMLEHLNKLRLEGDRYVYLETEYIIDACISRSKRYKIDNANKLIAEEYPDYWKIKDSLRGY